MRPNPDPSATRAEERGVDRSGAVPSRRIPDALRFAHGLFRQRKYALAAEEYDRFLAMAPTGLDRIDAGFGLANARLYQGRYPEARRAFEAFLKEAPDDSRARTARYRLGELGYLTGDLPAARRALETFVATPGDHPGLEIAWTYLGDVCFGLKDLPGAQIAYERSLATYPRGRMADRARYGLGRTLAGLDQRERAVGMLRELARMGGPEWVDRAWLQVGVIEEAAGHFDQVIEAMAALERAAPGGGMRSEARYRRARALGRLGRVGDAEALLRALAADPAEPMAAQAALELATMELEQGRAETALATLDAALGRAPQTELKPALIFRSAEALRKQERLAEAEARFLQVVETAPTTSFADEAMKGAVQTALDRGDAATARRWAGQFAARFPRSPHRGEVRLLEARAAAKAGDHREAASLLEALLGTGPRAAAVGEPGLPIASSLAQDVRYELALVYRALGRAAEAQALLTRLAEGPGGPAAASAWFLLGQAHAEAGRFPEAIPLLERYLAASPRGDVTEFALAQLAVAQVGIGRGDDARKTLASLAERFPQSRALAPARLRLAEAALAAHEPDRAAELFRRVAGGGPVRNEPPPGAPAPTGVGPAPTSDPAVRLRALAGLGRALMELGRPAEAAATFDAVLNLAPRDSVAAEMAMARARAWEAADQPERALEAYSLAARQFPQSDQGPRATLARARLLARVGRHAEAAGSFEALLGDSDACRVLAQAGTPAAALLAEWGWALVDAARPAHADTVFARLLKEHPASPFAADARFNLAESASLAHNYPEVIRLLTPLTARNSDGRGTGVSPGSDPTPGGPSGPSPARGGGPIPPETSPAIRLLPAVLYRLGRTQVAIQDWGAAAATLDRLATEFPENPYRREARLLRAESALRRGDPAAAESGLATLLAEPADRSDPPGFLRVVRSRQVECWVALKRWKEVMTAVPALRAELAAGDPGLAELDYARGQALMGQGRLDEARAAFQAVIGARPGDELAAQAHLMCGETFFHQDRLHEALREFLRVDIVHDAPRWQAAALLEAGKVYERLDQWADAIESYERLEARFPGDPAAATAKARLEAARRHASSGSADPRPPAHVPDPDGSRSGRPERKR